MCKTVGRGGIRISASQDLQFIGERCDIVARHVFRTDQLDVVERAGKPIAIVTGSLLRPQDTMNRFAGSTEGTVDRRDVVGQLFAGTFKFLQGSRQLAVGAQPSLYVQS